MKLFEDTLSDICQFKNDQKLTKTFSFTHTFLPCVDCFRTAIQTTRDSTRNILLVSDPETVAPCFEAQAGCFPPFVREFTAAAVNDVIHHAV